MNRASPATGWVRNPTMKSPDLAPHLASSYELGWTSNPLTGCLNRTPEGLCLGGMFPCYAWKLANGRKRKSYLANKNVSWVNPLACHHRLDDPFYPRFWPDRLIEPMHKYRRWGKHSSVKHEQSPKGIFVCDMSDLFGIGIPEDWTQKVMGVIRKCPQHRFYLLTKQPQNLHKFSPFPDNCWVGVTATDEPSLVNACQELHYIEAKIKYLSIEPLLNWFQDFITYGVNYWLKYGDVGLVIIGAQTKPYRPPEIEWVREIVSAADHAGIPIFLKDNLKPLLPNRMPFYDVYSYWSEDRTHKLYENRLRQEMPR